MRVSKPEQVLRCRCRQGDCSHVRTGAAPTATEPVRAATARPGLRCGRCVRRPGKFATNIAAGATYGYLLCWVVVGANLMAVLVQYLAAKASIATGRTLPQLCRDHFRRSTSTGLWAQAEVVAIATDLAEVVGGAIALNLLFSIPLLLGGVITGAVSFALLIYQSKRGQRPFEAAIIGLLAVVLIGFVVSTAKSDPSASGVVGGLVPRLDGTQSLVLAAGMLGATVMPHAIWLHGALVTDRHWKASAPKKANRGYYAPPASTSPSPWPWPARSTWRWSSWPRPR